MCVICRSPLEHLHYSELVIVVSYQMNSFSPAISWREQATFDEMKMMVTLY
jgi:hypothetical protein